MNQSEIKSAEAVLRKHWESETNKQVKELIYDAMHEYANQFKSEWVAIESYDTENRPHVMRWHKVWECPVCVFLQPNGAWVEKTLTTVWPDVAFEPFFQALPTPPKV